jgi:hypothetical protein
MLTLKIAGITIAVLIIVVLAYAATKPDVFRVQRSTTIKARPDKIYPLINDLHEWRSWSPYERLDPDLKRTYSGATSGPGAVYDWDGNSKAGQGRMEITDVYVPSQINIKLDFARPFEGHCTAGFTLEPKGDATQVTWSMAGSNNYCAKLMSVFLNMDKMVGKDFEAGLANLKEITEKRS